MRPGVERTRWGTSGVYFVGMVFGVGARKMSADKLEYQAGAGL